LKIFKKRLDKGFIKFYNKIMRIELDLIPFEEAARMIPCHKTLLYYYLKRDKIPVYVIANRYFIDNETLEEIRKNLKEKKWTYKKN